MTNDKFIDKVLSKTFWGSFLFLNGHGLNVENFEGIFYNGEYIDDEDELEVLRDWIIQAMKSKSAENIEDGDAIWKKYPIELLENGDVLDSSRIQTEPTHDIFFVIFLNDNTWEIQIEELDSEFEDENLDSYDDSIENEGIDIYVNPEEME